MKDEIKEILDKLKEAAIWYDDSKLLLDYITNLQEENERLNNIINEIFEWMQNKYDNSDLTGFTVSFQELQDLKELKGGK